jgi:hypothetical protein
MTSIGILNSMSIDPTSAIASALGISASAAIFLTVVILLWSLFWKGIALWKSSRRNSKIWFIFLLIVNTIGILEILYIFVFSKINLKSSKKVKTKSSKRR